MGELTKVTVDFDTSHLLFPTLVACVIGLLGLAIVIRERHAILASGTYWKGVLSKIDKQRFFGTLVLTLVYFSLMIPVGNIWPNTGMGFLICSIPFVFLSGLLFMHDRSVRQSILLAVVAVVAPTFVWWLFTYPFFLTLP